jgi:hypothetical protein
MSESRFYAYKIICYSFGPHKLAKAFDVFLERRAAPTQPSISQPEPISTDQLPPGSIPIFSTVMDLPVSNTKISTSAVDLSSDLNLLSIATTDIIPISPQLPVSSRPFTVLLVEDNAINLKVKRQS